MRGDVEAHPVHSVRGPDGTASTLIAGTTHERAVHRTLWEVKDNDTRNEMWHAWSMAIDVRPARASDIPFLAWVQQEAARSHLPRGFWDLAFPGPDEQRLRMIGRFAGAAAQSFCHWSGFLVAEVDGVPAAGLTGYARPSLAAGQLFVDAMAEAFDAEGWTAEQRDAMAIRTAPFVTCLPDTPEEAWIVEWVATRPEHRGRGIIRTLLESIIARGRERGHAVLQVCILIGNTPAQRAYEGAGFCVADEKRHQDFEAALGSPGICRLVLR